MAISTLTLTTPKPHNPLQSLGSKHSPVSKPPLSPPPPFPPCFPRSCSSLASNATMCVSSSSAAKTLASNVGVGFLAASVLALCPLDADATRVEYYATVGEPTCELSFARSGLGFCDVAVGPGEEVPRGELVNVSEPIDFCSFYLAWFVTAFQSKWSNIFYFSRSHCVICYYLMELSKHRD